MASLWTRYEKERLRWSGRVKRRCKDEHVERCKGKVIAAVRRGRGRPKKN